MWLADPGAMAYMVLGPRTVEAGLRQGATWLQESIVRRQLPDEADLSALAEAIDEVVAALCRVVAGGDAKAKLNVRELRILVADQWLASTIVPFSSHWTRPQAALATARDSLETAGSSLGPADTIRVDDAPYLQARAILGYPAGLLEALQAAAAKLGTVLSSVLPISGAAWLASRTARRRGFTALAVLAEDSAALVAGRSRPCELIVRPGLPPAPTEQGQADLAVPFVTGLWQRARLRQRQLQTVAHLEVLDLRDGASTDWTRPDAGLSRAVPGPRSDGEASAALQLASMLAKVRDPLDAMADRPVRRPSLWAATALGSGACVAVLMNAVQVRVDLVDARKALQSDSPAAIRTAVATPWTKEELGRIQAVNAATRQLNLPLADTMKALAPPADIRVGLLSIEATGSSGMKSQSSAAIRIVAEARTGAEMARYVAFLSARRPIANVFLVHHEIVEADAQRPYRFTLDAWLDS